MIYRQTQTPIGLLTILERDDAICSIFFENQKDSLSDDASEQHSFLLDETVRQIKAYFEGNKPPFDVPLLYTGTAFQKRVLNELNNIPYGSTLSYQEIAQKINRPRSYRAVGSACGYNPIPVIIPCHRVIASNRGMGGFGGGIEIKKWLLAHESNSAHHP